MPMIGCGGPRRWPVTAHRRRCISRPPTTAVSNVSRGGALALRCDLRGVVEQCAPEPGEAAAAGRARTERRRDRHLNGVLAVGVELDRACGADGFDRVDCARGCVMFAVAEQ